MGKPPNLITVAGLDRLLEILADAGYELIGPRRRHDAIVLDRIRTVSDLPRGWTDVQEAGRYRLEQRADDALFGFNVGPQSLKNFLHPPDRRLWQANRSVSSEPSSGTADFAIVPEPVPDTRYAFVGVRACELYAVAVQDRVFRDNTFADPHYTALRDNAFFVAVNCGQAGATCFCTSMGTGPTAKDGFDLALTELLDPDCHNFLVEAGSDKGVTILQTAAFPTATPRDIELARQIVENTTKQMGREMQTDDIRNLLYGNLEHPQWDEVAKRCLSCTNCTMVCPTCFCTTVEDTTDLTGDVAERRQHWDSCFNSDFSHIHGGNVRHSVKSRYRQWMTHKLASWHDQFETSGCVGCGRCITWCPVGIDITEEVAAIRETDMREEKKCKT